MPYIDPSHYQHPLDKKTLAALKSVPGFSQVVKAFMKVFDERVAYIENNSSNLLLGPKQLPEIWELLPPICERLGIEVPRMYLCNDRSVNAYTSGENEPFIVLHTGELELESMPTIQATIAHECGHIACHHVMYHTMGSMILGGATALIPGFGGLISLGLQLAFMQWMRASELSADRASALAMGGSDEVVSYCLTMAGAPKRQKLNINREEFLNQAIAYEQAMNASSANKAFELIMTAENTHPLAAYRALEVMRWCETPEFKNMNDFLGKQKDSAAFEAPVASEDDTDAPSAPAEQNMYEQPLDEYSAAKPKSGARQSFCTQCGTPVEENTNFCRKCGARLNS